jgi:phenylpropionate dioxygenase-like ring-hydroxylating dioxygenase large terminal subunit
MKQSKDSEELTRVGPGTTMGNFMRQYWIPAARSSELASDGTPLRIMLLGEKLVAFRDTDGRVGVMDHQCPHRNASLVLGRNEEGGIRCIYHGWKFDVDGNCVDMPSVPAGQDFKDKVKARAYPTTERAGLLWVYMGARKTPPPFPAIEAALLPEEELEITFIHRDCNWLQSLEGDIDTSHFGFLHVGSVMPEHLAEDNPLRHTVTHRAPSSYLVADADWGTTYGAHRDAPGGQTYWRMANFMFPFWTQVPQADFSDNVDARAWVPLDDGHTMFIRLFRVKRANPAIVARDVDGNVVPGLVEAVDYLPNTTDWLGRWRPTGNASNDWEIDREAQCSGRIYSGISVIHMQDQAVTESMGVITDHSREHLGPGDQMIARTRRRLQRAAKALRDEGALPPGVEEPRIFLEARSGFFVSASRDDWRSQYQAQLAKAQRPGLSLLDDGSAAAKPEPVADAA